MAYLGKFILKPDTDFGRKPEILDSTIHLGSKAKLLGD